MQDGWNVTGVYNRSISRRNYTGRFIHGEPLRDLVDHGPEYDAIHASPPCQRFTHGNAAGDQASKHPDLIAPTRLLLGWLDVPWVIENVPRAPLRDPITLCGTMFDLVAIDDDGTLLHLRRHRLFELSGFHCSPPGPCQHAGVQQWAGAYGGARRDKVEARTVRKGGYVPSRRLQEESLLGVPRGMMTAHGLTQAVPPAYTHHLGLRVPGAPCLTAIGAVVTISSAAPVQP